MANARVELKLHPVQKQFIDSQAIFRGFVGGRGTGKSFVGSYDLLRRAKPGRLYLVVAPTYKTLKDASYRSFTEHARNLRFLSKMNLSDLRCTLGNGAEVLFRSADNPEGLRGPNLSGCWMDEASICPEDAYQIAIACLREAGEQGWLSATFTPRGKAHWTYKIFGKNVEARRKNAEHVAAGRPPAEAGDPHVELFTSRTADNPFLPATFEATLRGQYTSKMASQELEGNFLEGGGKMFNRAWFTQILKVAPAQARWVRYWDKACLVAGTPVATARGVVPIQDVRPGDWVHTRRGLRAVNRAWMAKRVDVVWSVRFGDGAVVTGTDDHPVWTENRGWTPLSRLCTNDSVRRFTNREGQWDEKRDRAESLTPKSLSSMGSFTAVAPASDTTKPTGGTRSRSGTTPTCFTAPSGGRPTVTFPAAMMSITKTKITITTPSTTWSASLTPSTCDSIGSGGVDHQMVRGWWDAWSHGPGRKPGRKSSARTAGGRRPPPPSGNSNARSAGAISPPRPSCPSSSSAPGLVWPVTAASPGSIASRKAAPSVRWSSWPTQKPTRAPRSAAWNSASGIPVYDLEVEGCHEFYADGVLVHNSTQDGGCHTCGVLMGADYTGRFYVADVVRGQWSTYQREAVIKMTAELDAVRYHHRVRIFVEQEPGSGGVDSLRGTIKNLAGYPVFGDRPSKDKRVRAEPFAAQAESGNVILIEPTSGLNWREDYLAELEAFPEGAADQVDATSGAFNKLIEGSASVPVSGGGGASPAGGSQIPGQAQTPQRGGPGGLGSGPDTALPNPFGGLQGGMRSPLGGGKGGLRF